MKGKFITIEGADGVGKSTLAYMLKATLCSLGHKVELLREPGSTTVGEEIRKILLNVNDDVINKYTETLLFAASRYQMVDYVDRCLNEGKFVICDRYIDSSYAYQAMYRKVGFDYVTDVHSNIIMPDLTFVIFRKDIYLQNKDRMENTVDQVEINNNFKMLLDIFKDRMIAVDNNTNDSGNTAVTSMMNTLVNKKYIKEYIKK